AADVPRPAQRSGQAGDGRGRGATGAARARVATRSSERWAVMARTRNGLGPAAPTAVQALTIALPYRRVSGDDQERDGVSLPDQERTCREYVARHGWVLGQEFKDVLKGTRDDRPGYQALLGEVRRLRAERQPIVVVVTALDRFGRHLMEQL